MNCKKCKATTCVKHPQYNALAADIRMVRAEKLAELTQEYIQKRTPGRMHWKELMLIDAGVYGSYTKKEAKRVAKALNKEAFSDNGNK